MGRSAEPHAEQKVAIITNTLIDHQVYISRKSTADLNVFQSISENNTPPLSSPHLTLRLSKEVSKVLQTKHVKLATTLTLAYTNVANRLTLG